MVILSLPKWETTILSCATELLFYKERKKIETSFSNGKKIATTKKKYYELGGIPVSGYKNYFYTPAEAAKKMVDTGHWGPWDSKPPR